MTSWMFTKTVQVSSKTVILGVLWEELKCGMVGGEYFCHQELQFSFLGLCKQTF